MEQTFGGFDNERARVVHNVHAELAKEMDTRIKEVFEINAALLDTPPVGTALAELNNPDKILVRDRLEARELTIADLKYVNNGYVAKQLKERIERIANLQLSSDKRNATSKMIDEVVALIQKQKGLERNANP